MIFILTRLFAQLVSLSIVTYWNDAIVATNLSWLFITFFLMTLSFRTFSRYFKKPLIFTFYFCLCLIAFLLLSAARIHINLLFSFAFGDVYSFFMTGVFLFYGFGELLPIGSDSDVGEASWVVNPATGASGSGGAGGFNAASGSGGNGWSESAANDPAREVSLAPFPPQLTHPVPFPAEPGSPDPVSPPPPIASFYSQIERAESLHARNIELAEDLQRIQEMQRNLENERSPYRGRELAARIDWEVHKLEGKVARNRALDMVRDAQLNIWRQGLDQELVRQQENESRLTLQRGFQSHSTNSLFEADSSRDN
ncbi:unnamed protein product [Arabidopsis halleri]